MSGLRVAREGMERICGRRSLASDLPSSHRHRPRRRTIQYSRAISAQIIKAAAYSIPAFAGMTTFIERRTSLQATPSRCRRKILCLQFDWRTMRRAIGGVIPGIAIAVKGFGGGDTLGSDQSFQRREPVAVIGFAGVGIALRLRALDLVGERSRPLVPREQAARMQRPRHHKGLRVPTLTKHRNPRLPP